MNLDNGLGEVINKNNMMIDTCTEKLAVVPHCNGMHFWLISHDIGNNDFFTWKVTEEGISGDTQSEFQLELLFLIPLQELVI